MPDWDWEFTVFEGPPNAFCLPGGKIGVYTGITEIAQSDNALAFVMAHEAAHAIGPHAGEKGAMGVLANAVVKGVSAGAAVAAGGQNPTAIAAIEAGVRALPTIAQFAVVRAPRNTRPTPWASS